MKEIWRKEALTDVVNVALGAWLFLTPWLFGFVAETAASWNAWVFGVIIAALAVAALAAYAEWEEWLSFAAGVWVAIAPWALGFSGHTAAMRVHLITGIVVAVLAAFKLWYVRNRAQRATT